MEERSETQNIRKAQLTKSKTDRVLSGVCGGLAEYFGIDPVFVRVAFVVLAMIDGAGVLLYIILAVIMPGEESVDKTPEDIVQENVSEMAEQVKEMIEDVGKGVEEGDVGTGAATPRSPDSQKPERARWIGAILILLGIIFLLDDLRLFWWLSKDIFWPLILILIGIWLLVKRWER